MNILIVAAHPDDEVLGCGGTIAKLSKKNSVYTLILGEGITSRDFKEKDELLNKLKSQAIEANKILGVKKVYFGDLPDNKFDSIPLLSIIKKIENYIELIEPEVIYTHHWGDINIDHSLTSRAVLTAVRPVSFDFVREIIFFEIASSTEWGFPTTKDYFIPNIYSDISETIDLKLKAMQSYSLEVREYPHPRSIEGLKIIAKKRGLEIGREYAEAFFLARLII